MLRYQINALIIGFDRGLWFVLSNSLYSSYAICNKGMHFINVLISDIKVIKIIESIDKKRQIKKRAHL